MSLIYPSPGLLATEYLTNLKSFKPEVDTSKTDSDWWIRAQVQGGVLSGVYGDQRKIADDAFPQSARREAMQKHLNWYLDRDFNPATPSHGNAGVTGTMGTVIPSATEFIYLPNGNTYQSTEEVTLDAATGVVPVQSVGTGQVQNLLTGAPLTISSPPSGLNSGAVTVGPLADGRDIESTAEAAQAVLDFVRQPPAGGTVADYKRFAQEADPSVVEANVIRYIAGLGTLGIVISAGTTDIDGALDNGIPVVRVPSDVLVETVQEYVDTKAVATDCVTVLGPQVLTMDVNAHVRFANGDQNTVLEAFGLTQGELVQREIKRGIYKTPPGGRQFGDNGFVVLSELEEVVDLGLSSAPYTVGKYAQILVDRQLEDLSATGSNLMILPNQMVEPGTITIIEDL
jgi:uncharacterized phage protein gp47/JayE